MQRKEIVAKKQQYMYPAVANYFADPLPMERGEMQHIWDVDGKRYLDFFGGIVTVGVGHANPRITRRRRRRSTSWVTPPRCIRTRRWWSWRKKSRRSLPGG